MLLTAIIIINVIMMIMIIINHRPLVECKAAVTCNFCQVLN